MSDIKIKAKTVRMELKTDWGTEEIQNEFQEFIKDRNSDKYTGTIELEDIIICEKGSL